MLAKDLMTTPAISVTPDTSVRKAIRMMLEKNISGLPVTDDSGALCGMITEGDLLNSSMVNFANRKPPEKTNQTFFEEYVRAHASVVSDCMSRDVVSASPEDALPALVSLMRAKKVKRLPVVAEGKLVGVVSRYDVLKAITTGRDVVADGEDALRLAVKSRLQEELGLGPEEVSVHVSGCVLELASQGADTAKQRAMELVAESVAGVAGVVFRSH
ncbi:CBS domain-containing protein [Agrobacterium tumefaciens]|uniref:CBS domain-containing protein n=1 Tax=Agrobacterium tumefaciens TaxID=358 RepID=UPI0015740CC7|nr:CBS domain-containing protein [Agrobacterium tumefaciens]WCK68734.1 CBS domain-containing protein [Agrobacterium tumefaciens]